MLPKYIGTLSSVSVLLALATTPVSADSFAIEEIIVTAQKRAQSAQDIGVSVSALNAEKLESLRMSTPKDIAQHTPGLSTVNSNSGSVPIFAIRGIGLDDFNANNSSGVAVYMDGVYASSPLYLSGQLFDVEQVEVLKGPQSALYGRNSTGGAINFVSKAPTDTLSGEVNIEYGRWNTSKVSGFVSGPISDTVKGRIAANVENGDGWQEDVETGEEYGETDRYALKGAIELSPSDTFSASLRMQLSRDKSRPPTPQAYGTELGGEALSQLYLGFDVIPGVLDYLGIPLEGLLDSPQDADAVRVGGFDVSRDESGESVVLTMDWDLGIANLVSISGWDHYERKVNDNIGGTPAALLDTHYDEEAEQFSQEFRLVSNGSADIDWVAGLTYARDTLDSIKDSDGSVSLGQISNVYDTGFIGSFQHYKQTADSYAAYVHVENHFSDSWTLTLSGRYSYDERSFNGSTMVTGLAPDILFRYFPGDVPDSLDETHDEESFAYRVGLDYKLGADWLLYANVSTGFKSGIFYGGSTFEPGAASYVKPEEVITYELGFKSTLLDETMQLNGAYFYTEYDDRQTLITALFGGGVDVALANVPTAKVQGGELELLWRPAQSLEISAGLGYLDSEVISEISDVRGFPLLEPLEKGATFPQAPEWSFNALASYDLNLTEQLNARIQLDYSYTDTQKAALADTHAQYGPLKEVGLRATVFSSNEDWEVSLWGRNLNDNDANTYVFTNFLLGKTVYRQLPRSYGVSLKYRFP